MDTEFLKSLLTDAYPHAHPLMTRTLAPKPTLLILSVEGTDAWLRSELRGDSPRAHKTQMVVCHDHREADRVFAQWCQLKQRQGIIIGGACSVRYEGPETIAREKARYA